MVRFNRGFAAAVAGAVIATLLALAPAAMANIAPEITNATVTPSSLPAVGGTVTVDATAIDTEGGGVTFVYVEVTGPYTFQTALSQGSGAGEWFGDIELPQNFSTEGPVSWQFTVVARDLDNEEGRGYAGEVQVDAAPVFDEPPVVSAPSVDPRDLPSQGGPVKLGVSASDLLGISEVYADVTAAGGATTRVPLEPVSADRFEGVFDAPAATGTATAQYSVQLVALDSIGQAGSVDAGVISVAGKPSGRLEIKTPAIDFATTRVGTRELRSVMVRNVGARSTAPVEGVVTTSGAPFFVAGAPTTGVPFRLRAGETRTFLVEFRPTAPGARTGTLLVRRPDLVQPELSIPLSGTGIACKGSPWRWAPLRGCAR